MKTLREWLKETYKLDAFGHQTTRPRIVCKDGFSMSVQAGYYVYSEPREDLKDGGYFDVEIGFPSEEENLICSYAEDYDDYTETVYPYVPVEVVEKVIEKHGGIVRESEVSGNEYDGE